MRYIDLRLLYFTLLTGTELSIYDQLVSYAACRWKLIHVSYLTWQIIKRSERYYWGYASCLFSFIGIGDVTIMGTSSFQRLITTLFRHRAEKDFDGGNAAVIRLAYTVSRVWSRAN